MGQYMSTLNEDIDRIGVVVAHINELVGVDRFFDEPYVPRGQWNTISAFGGPERFTVSVDRREVKQYTDQKLAALVKHRTIMQLRDVLDSVAGTIEKLEE